MAYKHKIFDILLILIISFSIFNIEFFRVDGENQTVYATDENGTKYYSPRDAWDAAVNNGHIITMQEDWYVEGYLICYEGKTASLHMNGHKIEGTDEITGLFYLNSNSTLYLYGGESTTFTYTGYDHDGNKITNCKVTSGGLLTNGQSTKGGGAISVASNAKLYIKDVAIAGNYSVIDNYGGGAIKAFGDNCFFELNNVLITYNYAFGSAGAIIITGSNITGVLKNTSITHNSARRHTGGICVPGENSVVDIIEGSSISYNYSKGNAGGISIGYRNNTVKSSDKTGVIEYNQAKSYGAGVVFNSKSNKYGNLGSLIDNLTIRNNYCTDGNINVDIEKIKYSGDGGGIYVDVAKATIANCTIENNGASLGGGVYVNGGSGNDATVIKDTTIKNNYTPGKGGGIFVSCTDDVKLSGDVYIENNKNGSEDDDVFLNTGFFDTKAYIYDDISSSSRVGIKLDTVNDYRDLVKNVSNYIDGTYFLDAYTDECYLNYSNNTLSSKRGATTYLVTVDKEELGRYKVGSTVTLTSSKDFFYGYKTNDLKEKVLRPSSNSKSISFTMPSCPVSLTSAYYQSINEATLGVDAPVAGQPLPTKAILSWTNEDGSQEKEVSVSWLEYLNGSYKEVTSNIAAYGTDYSVKANILQDKDKNLFFASNLDKYGNFKVIYKDGDNSYTYTAKADGGGSYVSLIGNSYTTELGKVYVNDVLIGSYAKGTTVVIDGTDSDKRFINWNNSSQVTIENLNKAATSFIMSDDKEIKLSANYASPITNATLTVGLPKVGSNFTDLHGGIFSYEVNGNSYQISGDDIYISWRIKQSDNEDDYAGMDSAISYNTKYMAFTTIDSNEAKHLTFNSNMQVKVIYTDGTNFIEKDSTIKINNGILYITADPITTAKRQIKFPAYYHYAKVKTGDTFDSLPKTCTAVLEGNVYVDAKLDYSKVSDWKGIYSDGKFIKTSNAYTFIEVPFSNNESEYGNTNNVTATVAICVDGEDPIIKEPSLDIEPGSYEDSITITLKQDDNKSIKYQLTTVKADGNKTVSEELDYTNPIQLVSIEDEITTYTLTTWAYENEYTSNKISYTYKVGKKTVYHALTLKYKLTDGTSNEYTLKTYNCKDKDSITLVPIDVQNAEFAYWDTTNKDNDVITIENVTSDMTIYAIYNPIISSIDFTINDLKIGDTLPTNIKDAGISMKLDNGKFDLSSYLKDFTWLTSDTSVLPNKNYTAKVSLDNNIDTSKYTFVIYENNYKITVNGDEESLINVNLNDDGTIYFTYPKSDKLSITSISKLDPLSINREDYKNNNYSLPSSVNITLSNNQIISCPISFNTLSFDLDNPYGQTKTIEGSLILADYVYDDGSTVDLEVTLKQAFKLSMPYATMTGGEYEDTIYVRLYSLDNDDIYYSINNSEYMLYKDELFEFKANTTLKIKSIKQGYFDSDINTYNYTFKEEPKKEEKENTSSDTKDETKIITCEEYMHSKDWMWSTNKNACVYKVSNTGSKNGY